jgi:hypothetical protein
MINVHMSELSKFELFEICISDPPPVNILNGIRKAM